MSWLNPPARSDESPFLPFGRGIQIFALLAPEFKNQAPATATIRLSGARRPPQPQPPQRRRHTAPSGTGLTSTASTAHRHSAQRPSPATQRPLPAAWLRHPATLSISPPTPGAHRRDPASRHTGRSPHGHSGCWHAARRGVREGKRRKGGRTGAGGMDALIGHRGGRRDGRGGGDGEAGGDTETEGGTKGKGRRDGGTRDGGIGVRGGRRITQRQRHLIPPAAPTTPPSPPRQHLRRCCAQRPSTGIVVPRAVTIASYVRQACPTMPIAF
jgi:hypothetical protein